MKFRIVFLISFFFSLFDSFAQIRDSVQIGLPTTTGVKNFTLVQTRWANSPAVFESILILAIPAQSPGIFRDRISSEQFKTFSNTNKVGLAILYGNADTSFASLSNPTLLGDSIKRALQKLALKSNRPEWNNAPILACGMAASSRFALACGSALPARTAGMVSLRAYRLTPFAGSSVTEIPHLVLTGELSGPDVRDNAGLYFSSQLQPQVLTRRAAGELIRHAIEMNASQYTFSDKTVSYLLDFAGRCIQKRIPANSNPVAGPVALNAIAANSGWLGKSVVWNSFVSSNYSISAFAGPLVPASSQWFFDQQDAQKWKSFHETAFDSVLISPLPNPVVPYCSGLRPSALSANIYLKAGTVLNPDNYFRMEVSDVTGNFDHPVYSARWFGTTLSSSLVDSIVDGTISDNFTYMTPVSDPNVRRYRIRVVSTSPYYESSNFGEVDIPFCGAGGVTKPRVYLSLLRPFRKFYNPGDSIAVMVYKNPEYTYAGSGIRIELSNKNGQLTAGLTTNLFTGVPPFSASASLDSFLVKMKLPDTLSYGPRYRLKVYIDGVSNQQSRQTSTNGHDISIVPNQSGNQIQLNTVAASSIQQTTAVAGGSILFDGGSPVLERGVCWSVNPLPTTASSKTSDGTGIGTFSSNVSGLQPGTQYFLRAYARNANQTAYGQEISFTTLLADQVPVLSTNPISAITQIEAQSGGNITFDGNSPVTVRGICWSTGNNPTIDLLSKTEDGTGTGSFISNLTGLSPGTQYCVRAYAVNTTGVGYGNEVCFTTEAAAVVIPTVSSNNVFQLSTCDSARCGGNVSAGGGGTVTARGVVWSSSPAPTVDLLTKTVDGSGTGAFVSLVSGLSSATTYYLRAYATNSAGTAYGDEVVLTTCVSVKDVISLSTIFLVPNPARDAVKIVSKDFRLTAVRLMNLQGKSIPVAQSISEEGVSLDLRDLPFGSYFIQVQTSSGARILPLIKN